MPIFIYRVVKYELSKSEYCCIMGTAKYMDLQPLVIDNQLVKNNLEPLNKTSVKNILYKCKHNL